jgi:cytochrome c5
VLEVLGLNDEYSEAELEEPLIRELEQFLLELGNDFAFIARQKRLRVGTEWYRVDLLFFHRAVIRSSGAPAIPELTYDFSPELVHKGAQIFKSRCMLCHGLNAVSASLPDLSYASKHRIESLDRVLLDGVLAPAGMPSYKKILSADDVKALQAYIVSRARESVTASPVTPKP